MTKILIIEDEVEIADYLCQSLAENNYETRALHQGKNAMETLHSYKPDLVILDQCLPDAHGHEILKLIRAEPETQNIPVIILTELSQEDVIIKAFDYGADDYIEKPFSLNILLRRIKAVLSRSLPEEALSGVMEKDGLVIDNNAYKVLVNHHPLETTLMEFNILRQLFLANGKTLTREDLIHKINDGANVTNRTIDVHICAIRKKLNDYGHNIETIRGVGYRLQTSSSHLSLNTDADPEKTNLETY